MVVDIQKQSLYISRWGWILLFLVIFLFMQVNSWFNTWYYFIDEFRRTVTGTEHFFVAIDMILFLRDCQIILYCSSPPDDLCSSCWVNCCWSYKMLLHSNFLVLVPFLAELFLHLTWTTQIPKYQWQSSYLLSM